MLENSGLKFLAEIWRVFQQLIELLQQSSALLLSLTLADFIQDLELVAVIGVC